MRNNSPCLLCLGTDSCADRAALPPLLACGLNTVDQTADVVIGIVQMASPAPPVGQAVIGCLHTGVTCCARCIRCRQRSIALHIAALRHEDVSPFSRWFHCAGRSGIPLIFTDMCSHASTTVSQQTTGLKAPYSRQTVIDRCPRCSCQRHPTASQATPRQSAEQTSLSSLTLLARGHHQRLPSSVPPTPVDVILDSMQQWFTIAFRMLPVSHLAHAGAPPAAALAGAADTGGCNLGLRTSMTHKCCSHVSCVAPCSRGAATSGCPRCCRRCRPAGRLPPDRCPPESWHPVVAPMHGLPPLACIVHDAQR